MLHFYLMYSHQCILHFHLDRAYMCICNIVACNATLANAKLHPRWLDSTLVALCSTSLCESCERVRPLPLRPACWLQEFWQLTNVSCRLRSHPTWMTMSESELRVSPGSTKEEEAKRAKEAPGRCLQPSGMSRSHPALDDLLHMKILKPTHIITLAHVWWLVIIPLDSQHGGWKMDP